MKKTFVVLVIAAGIFILTAFTKKTTVDNEVPYPEAYRSWTHIKSAIVSSKDPSKEHSRGYHHIYANDKAMEGYKTGKFPNGSVIVADFIEMVENESTITEGKRKFIDVMVKDTDKYKSTGGWGYEEFDGDSKEKRIVTQAKAGTACYNCHAPQAEKDYVFSKYRE